MPRLLVALLAVTLASAAGLLAAPPPDASAARLLCDADGEGDPPLAIGDVDGDEVADVAVGLPGYTTSSGVVSAEAGAVVVRLSSGSTQFLDLGDFPDLGGLHEGDRFGAAVGIGDVDHDGCADLLVGAPGRTGTGAVYLLHGSPAGISTAGAERLGLPAASGDRLGSALALARRPGGRTTDLWVGAPGRDVAGRRDAGAVDHVAFGPAGVTGAVEVLTEGSAAVGDTAERGDAFGSVLAPARFGALAGVPREDVGGRTDAGALVRLRLSRATGTAAPAQILTQRSPGVPRAARPGNRFGAAVAADVLGAGAIVGAPGSDVGRARDAGAVQLFAERSSPRYSLRPARAHTEGDGRTPGHARRGDAFGAAVAYGRALQCPEAAAYAIGAPGEDVAGAPDSGSVTLLSPGPEGCRSRVLREGWGLPRPRRRGDALGSALALRRDRDDLDEDVADTLLVGVPGRDGAVGPDVGLVFLRQAALAPVHTDAFALPSGRFSRLRFGAVLGVPEAGYSF